jgi:hypothetical protein
MPNLTIDQLETAIQEQQKFVDGWKIILANKIYTADAAGNEYNAMDRGLRKNNQDLAKIDLGLHGGEWSKTRISKKYDFENKITADWSMDQMRSFKQDDSIEIMQSKLATVYQPTLDNLKAEKQRLLDQGTQISQIQSTTSEAQALDTIKQSGNLNNVLVVAIALGVIFIAYKIFF